MVLKEHLSVLDSILQSQPISAIVIHRSTYTITEIYYRNAPKYSRFIGQDFRRCVCRLLGEVQHYREYWYS